VFAINLKGVWHCAQFAARDMIKRRSGRIINIASIAGRFPVWISAPIVSQRPR
jgi:NAD(P)-dependent dehydrogenase (short-subunit alcohol dehydrogenase family)